VKVWDTSTGLIRAELPGLSCVAFSPDGQWLGLDDGSGYRFFKSGTWSLVSKVGYQVGKAPTPGNMRIAFHPVGHIAAVLGGDWSVVLLVDVRTGRVLAPLEGPNESQVHRLIFSPDDRFLAVSHSDQKVDLWDLSVIRRRLQEMNLGAGFPDLFTGRSTAEGLPSIERIEVKGAVTDGLRLLEPRRTLRDAVLTIRSLTDPDLADSEALLRRSAVWSRLGRRQLAESDLRRSMAPPPQSAIALNQLAWSLVVAAGSCEPYEAVRWARKAAELEPANPDIRNTLGVALYRAGRYAEAAAAFQRNVDQNVPFVGYDWAFLAMCKQRLGQQAAARAALARARQWNLPAYAANPAMKAEFLGFLQEAQAVLKEPLPDLPPTVFDR
jgi:hypothetical protein